MKLYVFSIVAFVLGSLAGFAAPKDVENYYINSDQFRDIPDGAVLQGSVKHGGTQPDYLIDAKSPVLRPLWDFCHKVRESSLPKWEKVDAVVQYIRKIVPNGSYDSPPYLRLLEKHRNIGSDIPISEYVACEAAVCRENAILTHLALKEAGIPNKHVYVKTEIYYAESSLHKIEDHGFAVIEEGSNRWIVDSYWAQFNGYEFNELYSPSGVAISEPKKRLPFALSRSERRRIVKINQYPNMWIPKKMKMNGRCPSMFQMLSSEKK